MEEELRLQKIEFEKRMKEMNGAKDKEKLR